MASQIGSIDGNSFPHSKSEQQACSAQKYRVASHSEHRQIHMDSFSPQTIAPNDDRSPSTDTQPKTDSSPPLYFEQCLSAAPGADLESFRMDLARTFDSFDELGRFVLHISQLTYIPLSKLQQIIRFKSKEGIRELSHRILFVLSQRHAPPSKILEAAQNYREHRSSLSLEDYVDNFGINELTTTLSLVKPELPLTDLYSEFTSTFDTFEKLNRFFLCLKTVVSIPERVTESFHNVSKDVKDTPKHTSFLLNLLAVFTTLTPQHLLQAATLYKRDISVESLESTCRDNSLLRFEDKLSTAKPTDLSSLSNEFSQAFDSSEKRSQFFAHVAQIKHIPLHTLQQISKGFLSTDTPQLLLSFLGNENISYSDLIVATQNYRTSSSSKNLDDYIRNFGLDELTLAVSTLTHSKQITSLHHEFEATFDSFEKLETFYLCLDAFTSLPMHIQRPMPTGTESTTAHVNDATFTLLFQLSQLDANIALHITEAVRSCKTAHSTRPLPTIKHNESENESDNEISYSANETESPAPSDGSDIDSPTDRLPPVLLTDNTDDPEPTCQHSAIDHYKMVLQSLTDRQHLKKLTDETLTVFDSFEKLENFYLCLRTLKHLPPTIKRNIDSFKPSCIRHATFSMLYDFVTITDVSPLDLIKALELYKTTPSREFLQTQIDKCNLSHLEQRLRDLKPSTPINRLTTDFLAIFDSHEKIQQLCLQLAQVHHVPLDIMRELLKNENQKKTASYCLEKLLLCSTCHNIGASDFISAIRRYTESSCTPSLKEFVQQFGMKDYTHTLSLLHGPEELEHIAEETAVVFDSFEKLERFYTCLRSVVYIPADIKRSVDSRPIQIIIKSLLCRLVEETATTPKHILDALDLYQQPPSTVSLQPVDKHVGLDYLELRVRKMKDRTKLKTLVAEMKDSFRSFSELQTFCMCLHAQTRVPMYQLQSLLDAINHNQPDTYRMFLTDIAGNVFMTKQHFIQAIEQYKTNPQIESLQSYVQNFNMSHFQSVIKALPNRKSLPFVFSEMMVIFPDTFSLELFCKCLIQRFNFPSDLIEQVRPRYAIHSQYTGALLSYIVDHSSLSIPDFLSALWITQTVLDAQDKLESEQLQKTLPTLAEKLYTTYTSLNMDKDRLCIYLADEVQKQFPKNKPLQSRCLKQLSRFFHGDKNHPFESQSLVEATLEARELL